MSESPQPQPANPAEPKAAGAPSPAGITPPAATASRWGLLGFFWTLCLRLGWLGIALGLGGMVGILVALVLPGSVSEPPLPEIAARRSAYTLRKLRQLPQWWQGDRPDQAELLPTSGPLAQPAPPPPAPEFSPAEQTRIGEELTSLQDDVNALSTRITALETELRVAQPAASLERRLRQLEQAYGGLKDPAPATTAQDAAEDAAAPAAGPEPSAPVEPSVPWPDRVSDRIVLPSSLLFEANSGTLTPTGEQLLETILPDLLRYPGATLLVGSHSGGEQAPAVYRELTFQQAAAVQRYLEQRLGDGFRWVTIGYGQTRPRVEGRSAATQARNQRVEIAILPDS